MRKMMLFSSLIIVITIFSVALLSATQIDCASLLEHNLCTHPNSMGDSMGDKGIWAVDASAYTIIADGDLSEWEGLAFEMFSGVNVSLAFDATNVYIALQWIDTTYDVSVGQWNKTGLNNPSLVDWNFIDGAGDVIQVGFSDGVDTDIMIWTASNRTNAGLAFECDDVGTPDGGTLPYRMNTNETDTFEDAKPIVDSNWVSIANEFILPNGTMYDAWEDVLTNVATGSQANTIVASDYNSTLQDYYTVEMIRLLDTTETDDFVIDFSSSLSFELGFANCDNTYNMLISTQSFDVSSTNEAADLTFTTIVGEIQNQAFVITGGVFDDFSDYTLTVQLSGWSDTYGPGAWFAPDVNAVTGNYSFLFFFGEWDMPLGEQTIFVTFYPLYENPIQLNQTIVIDDTKAPTIQGIVDLNDRYPNGVPLDEDYVIVTVGLDDDYCINNDITAFLYSYKDGEVALQTDMVQFASGSTTFMGNISIEHALNEANNYTYFIEAWDTNLNKVTSEYFWFTTAASTTPTPPPETTSVNTKITPLPTLEIALSAIALLTIISKASKKKRK